MAKAKIEEVLDYIQPTKYTVSSTLYSDDFSIPVLTPGDSFILGYTNETKGAYEASKNAPIILFDDFTTAIKWVDFPFKVKSSACKILVPKKDCNLRYMYYLMKHVDFDNSQHKRYWISEFSKIQYEQKDIKNQNIIVNILDKINELITIKNNKLLKLDEMI